MFFGNLSYPVQTVSDGALFSCGFSIGSGAAPGTTTLTGDTLILSDATANVMPSTPVSGQVTITAPPPPPGCG